MAMTRSTGWQVLLLGFGLAAAHGAHAVNLLSNGTFNVDTSSGTVEEPQFASLAFSSTDANGSPTSGSAQVTTFHAGPGQGTGICA